MRGVHFLRGVDECDVRGVVCVMLCSVHCVGVLVFVVFGADVGCGLRF